MMNRNRVFKKFLDKYDKEKKLLKYLSDDEVAKLNTLSPFYKVPDQKMLKESIIDQVHYSWFIPMLNVYSKPEASLFLLCLKPSNRKALKDLLDLEDVENNLQPYTKDFLKEKLTQSLIKKEDSLLPIECLKASKLNEILSLSKTKIIKLIDFLAMYDVAKELKFIVDKKKLKKIYSYLKSDEKAFLKKILNKKEAFESKRINIEKYILEKSKFRRILHSLGLIRLSIALSKESIDLIPVLQIHFDEGVVIMVSDASALLLVGFILLVFSAFGILMLILWIGDRRAPKVPLVK